MDGFCLGKLMQAQRTQRGRQSGWGVGDWGGCGGLGGCGDGGLGELGQG